MANTFSLEIEHLVKDTDMTYMDAIVWAAASKELEVETAAKLLNKNIKNKRIRNLLKDWTKKTVNYGIITT